MSQYSTHPTTAPGAPVPNAAVMQQERDSGKIVLMGGLAAGIVGGLLVLLGEREEEQQQPATRLEQARKAIEDASAAARKQGLQLEGDVAGAVGSLRKDAKKSRKDARKRGRKMTRKTRKETEATMSSIAGLLGAAREEVTARYHEAGKQVPDVGALAQQFRSETASVAGDARKRGKKARKQAGKDVVKARQEAGSLLDVLKTRAVEAEKVAEGYVESRLLPRLKEFEQEAVSAFETGKKTSQAKSSDLLHRASEDIIPQVKQKATDALHRAEDDLLPEAKKKAAEVIERAEKDLLPQAREAAGKARQELDGSAQVAAQKLSAARGVAGEQAHEAGVAVKRGGRETRSLLVWLGLGGALVYNVFLNDEQQRKVRELGVELLGEAKEMYADIKSDGPSHTA